MLYHDEEEHDESVGDPGQRGEDALDDLLEGLYALEEAEDAEGLEEPQHRDAGQVVDRLSQTTTRFDQLQPQERAGDFWRRGSLGLLMGLLPARGLR